MLLPICVALARPRVSSRGLSTATGATDDIMSRLPMYESASLSHDNRCCPINISAEELQDHKCVPQDTNRRFALTKTVFSTSPIVHTTVRTTDDRHLTGLHHLWSTSPALPSPAHSCCDRDAPMSPTDLVGTFDDDSTRRTVSTSSCPIRHRAVRRERNQGYPHPS